MGPRTDDRSPEDKLEHKQAVAEVESEAFEAAVGAAAGAAMGALAGPVGIAAGAALGAAAGAALGHQIKKANREWIQHDRDLDEGVVDEPVEDEMPGQSAEDLDAELEAQAASQRELEHPIALRGVR